MRMEVQCECPKNAGKMRGEIIFSPLWCLIQKLDHNSGLHAKNQREISKNKVRKPPPTLCMEMWTFPFVFNPIKAGGSESMYSLGGGVPRPPLRE